jgi:hypothetical protein
MTKRVHLLIAVAACVGMLAAVAAGSGAATASAQSRSVLVQRHDAVAHPATAAATTKFLLHAGLAYYAFDHYIWKPFKAGDLHGFTHKIKIVEAGLAAAFVYHEAKLMITDAKGSKLLSSLAVPITAVVAKLSSLKSDISGGNLNSVSNVQSDLGSIKQQSNSKGVMIKEIASSI